MKFEPFTEMGRADGFLCLGCGGWVAAGEGCDDDDPDLCDPCWLRKHRRAEAKKRRQPAPPSPGGEG